MADLRTTYMGLELGNPVVAASCGLVAKVEGVQKAEAAGAGAVVLKSLFEEQIRMEMADTESGVGDVSHPEAQAYLQSEGWMRHGPRDYCRFIEDCKKKVRIPVIASVNCTSGAWWADYTRDLESAGADAIELNILVPGTDPDRTGSDVEQVYIDVVRQVASQVGVPVAAKIGFTFGSLAYLSRSLVTAGARALVLFNRFHQPDIDIEELKLKHASPFSDPLEMHYSLRWIGILSGDVDCDLAATTGLHQSEQVIKQLLAGATVAQVCSTLYRNGFGQIGTILTGIEEWMDRKGFGSVSDFRGKLSYAKAESYAVYERRQYIKHLVGIS